MSPNKGGEAARGMNMKPDLTITRIKHKEFTIGLLETLLGFRCFTLELPWKDNASDVSCVPEGYYEAFKRLSPSNGEVIELCNVVNREYIQIHAGNYLSQILGCILVGESISDINKDGIPDVTNSCKTLGKLLQELPDKLLIQIK